MRGQRLSTAHRTRRLVVCAMLAALGVTIMALGALVELIDLTAAGAASLLLLPILYTYGQGWATVTFLVSGLLALLLMPQSMVAWVYLGLLGYYPILKTLLDRLPRVISYLCKFVLIVAVLAVYALAFYFMFMHGSGSFGELFFSAFGVAGAAEWIAGIFIALVLATFFLYDELLVRVERLYRLKWQGRVEKWMK